MRYRELIGLGGVALLVPLGAWAQNIVSARAGLIHHSDGQVLLNEKPVVRKLAQFQEIKETEYLRTGRGRAEVLLTPGIFLRLGEDSQAQMLSSRLTDVRLRLLSGAAVIEADEMEKSQAVTIVSGAAEVRLLRAGLYRLDAAKDASPRLRVFAGEALVRAPRGEFRVKNKKEIGLEGDFQIEKFLAEDTDALDRWSKRRASYLSIASVSAGRMAYNSGSSWDRSQWAWNPFFGMYTFLPYRNICWSPYGYGFYSPQAVYYLYNPPRFSTPSQMAARGSGYNSQYGYNTVAPTGGGTSGVVASSAGGGGGAVGGGGPTVSRGGDTGGGGARR